MITSIWYYWPWFSLLIFTLLVKGMFHFTRGSAYIAIGPPEQRQSPPDPIIWLLVLALIVGAALCILIENGF